MSVCIEFKDVSYAYPLDWLAENERFYPIRLHTMNPVGRENMLRMIRRYW